MNTEETIIKDIRLRVDKATDGLGKHIDKDIKNLVVAMNLHKIRTHQSCQGHPEWGHPYPWVSFSNFQSLKVIPLVKNRGDVEIAIFTVTHMQIVPKNILGRLKKIGLIYPSINKPLYYKRPSGQEKRSRRDAYRYEEGHGQICQISIR